MLHATSQAVGRMPSEVSEEPFAQIRTCDTAVVARRVGGRPLRLEHWRKLGGVQHHQPRLQT